MSTSDFSPDSIASAQRIFTSVMALPCKRHGSRPGEPCWAIDEHHALCGRRIDARGLHR